MLLTISHWFTEKFDMQDRQEAKTLLVELAPGALSARDGASQGPRTNAESTGR